MAEHPHQTYRDNFFIFSLKFRCCITSCECMNFVKLYRLVVPPMHSSINFSRASRPIISTFNRNDATSSFVLLPDVILNKQLFSISGEKGFIVILIISISLTSYIVFWDIWLDFRSCETSSLTVTSRSLNNCEMMLVRMK